MFFSGSFVGEESRGNIKGNMPNLARDSGGGWGNYGSDQGEVVVVYYYLFLFRSSSSSSSSSTISISISYIICIIIVIMGMDTSVVDSSPEIWGNHLSNYYYCYY